jgi:lysylphosphatidylglycerol synthetase-like protein (DUF2156 family)
MNTTAHQVATPPTPSPQSLEQYKAKLADLGNLGSRQTAMTTYYVSIVSALFGVLAFKEKALAQIDILVLFMVCGAGICVCMLWFYSLTFFRSLFCAKLRVLEEIEQSLPHQTFKREFELMRQSGVTSWIWIERFVPAVFALFFIGVVVLRLTQSHPVAKP